MTHKISGIEQISKELTTTTTTTMTMTADHIDMSPSALGRLEQMRALYKVDDPSATGTAHRDDF